MTDRPFPCGAMIKCLAEMLDKNANKNLADNGITFSQMKVLVMLHENGRDSVTMKELERYFDLTQATVAGIVARLEKKELIEGFTDPCDRRIKRVRITPEGRRVCEASKTAMTDYENRFLRALDEAERKELMRLMLKIYNDAQ